MAKAAKNVQSTPLWKLVLATAVGAAVSLLLERLVGVDILCYDANKLQQELQNCQAKCSSTGQDSVRVIGPDETADSSFMKSQLSRPQEIPDAFSKSSELPMLESPDKGPKPSIHVDAPLVPESSPATGEIYEKAYGPDLQSQPTASSEEAPAPAPPKMSPGPHKPSPYQGKKRATTFPTAFFCEDSHKSMSARDWEHGRVARLLGQHEVGEVSGTIQIVQVGSGSAERDTGFYSDEVQKFIDNPNVHAVLIEPNPVSFRRLKQNLVSRYGTVDRFTLLNTAVCPDASPALPLLKCCLFREGCDWPNPCPMIGKGPTIPFYVVSETFLQDYPNAPKWAVFQLGNADRQTVLKYHKQLGFGLTKDQFSKYITKIDVPCVNMRQLMDQHARLQANQVDFFDAPIDNWGAFIWEDWLVIGGQNAVGAVVERLHLRKLEQWTFYVSFGRHNFCIDEHKDSGLTIAYQNRGETAALKAARVQNPRKTMVQDRIKLLAKDTSKQLHFLQVGACDGDFDTKTSNDPVQSVIYQEHITAALVEPNPPMFKKLVKNVESFFGNTSRIRTFNMAMCPDKSGQVSFFVVKPEFAIEYPWKPHWAKYQLSSMNRDHILHKHGEVGMEKATWEKYILELRVPCKTPGDMLEAAGMKVKQVDLLQVDAEGYDAKIVEAFMKLKDFDPQIIVFEDVHLGPDEITHVTEILKKRNYHVHPKLRGNTMAIKPELERKDKNHKKR